jgi:mycothiol synthase
MWAAGIRPARRTPAAYIVIVRIDCPSGYRARPYGGRSDHAAMAAVLTARDRAHGHSQMTTEEEITRNYTHLTNCDLALDFALVEHEHDGTVGYTRTGWADTNDGERVHFVVAAIHPDHLSKSLFCAVINGCVDRVAEIAADHKAARPVIRTHAWRPMPDEPMPDGSAAWLEELGFTATRFLAAMVRPHLCDIPELPLPDHVELRPVSADQIRAVWEADVAANAGTWGETTDQEAGWEAFRDDPLLDASLWRVAWHGDDVVGQVKSFINHEENEAEGRLRGYTENIATHVDWRGKGIASALLAESLRAIRDRGMTEAALSVDTENPADAMGIYRRLGFVPVSYEAVYDKPLRTSATSG